MGSYNTPDSSVLHRQLRQKPPAAVVEGRGNYLITEDGQEIFDATSGAAVSCLGHSDERVHKAMLEQLQKIPYCYSVFHQPRCRKTVDVSGRLDWREDVSRVYRELRYFLT